MMENTSDTYHSSLTSRMKLTLNFSFELNINVLHIILFTNAGLNNYVLQGMPEQ
jgi:hypothetical protein